MRKTDSLLLPCSELSPGGGIRIKLFKRKQSDDPSVAAVQTVSRPSGGLGLLESYTPLSGNQIRLYYALREAVPIIDAAIFKLVRLTGGFTVNCSDRRYDAAIKNFIANVDVGGNQHGLDAFIATYFEQLLTCGTAVGEMVTDSTGHIAALYNAPLDNIELRRSSDGIGVDIFTSNCSVPAPVSRPELILLSVLNPEPGKLNGNSMLKGLPFVSSVLMKIYNSIGINWDRVGNLRFAVTYKPQNDSMDRAYAKERAMQVAKEWGEAMQTGSAVKDFVAVGDVQIKVIGADNQILDSEIPVRQMLEQIVAKTGLPPFMLGLSWSSTERMSAQQADVLTSEIDAYRRILTPVISRICSAYLQLEGMPCEVTLQDEVELSHAELYRAQAEKIRSEITQKE